MTDTSKILDRFTSLFSKENHGWDMPGLHKLRDEVMALPPYTPADIAAIKKRYGAASPGPWRVEGGDNAGRDAWISNPEISIARDIYAEDADFIAHSRKDVPELILEIERLYAHPPATDGFSAGQEAMREAAAKVADRYAAQNREGAVKQKRKASRLGNDPFGHGDGAYYAGQELDACASEAEALAAELRALPITKPDSTEGRG